MSTMKETGMLSVDISNNGESNDMRPDNRETIKSGITIEAKKPTEQSLIEVGGKMIKISDDGIFEVDSPAEYAALIAGNQDKIILIKFYSPYCRACKGLAPKYIALTKDERLANLPIVFAEMDTTKYHRDFAKKLGVKALPSIQFHVGQEGILENYPCAPTKVPILKKKLANLVNERVDKKTRKLKKSDVVVVVYED